MTIKRNRTGIWKPFAPYFVRLDGDGRPAWGVQLGLLSHTNPAAMDCRPHLSLILSVKVKGQKENEVPRIYLFKTLWRGKHERRRW